MNEKESLEDHFLTFGKEVNVIIFYEFKGKIHKIGLINTKLKEKDEIEKWFDDEFKSRKLKMKNYILRN
jgi:hypothetical protein